MVRRGLDELRAGVGLQIAIIAASVGLDVDDDPGSTLPGPEIRSQTLCRREMAEQEECWSCGCSALSDDESVIDL
jgi:hypothetical protein